MKQLTRACSAHRCFMGHLIWAWRDDGLQKNLFKRNGNVGF